MSSFVKDVHCTNFQPLIYMEVETFEAIVLCYIYYHVKTVLPETSYEYCKYFNIRDNFAKSRSSQNVTCRLSVHFSMQKNMVFIMKAKRNRH